MLNLIMQLTQTSGMSIEGFSRFEYLAWGPYSSADLVASDHTAMVEAALCQMSFLEEPK